MKAYAVIGSNLGDEGKGSVTDALAANLDSVLVIRHNSGAQCSHTVSHNGIRHIFSHIGAGTLANAHTYLSQYFVVHPQLFMMELNELKEKGITPTVIVDRYCYITTPFDVMLNRWAEEDRGENKHGSCGIGFGETIERSLVFHTSFDHLIRYIRTNGIQFWIYIVQDYYKERMNKLGINPTEERLKYLQTGESDHYWASVDAWIADYEIMLNHVTMAPEDLSLMPVKYDNYIFEGAQGLQLDQSYPWFPYVTRSNTGLTNVVTVAKELRIEKVNPIYVTRTYLTRHGAGPLPGETEFLEGFKLEDDTNVLNKWQGKLRYAPMDWKQLDKRILSDLSRSRDIVENPSIAITCIDQMHEFDIPRLELPISILRHGKNREDTEFIT